MAGAIYAGAAPWVAASERATRFGLFRRADGGEWEALARGLPEAVEIRTLAVDPDDAATIYAGTQDGPYRSTDGGDSWAALGPEGAGVTWSILVHPADPRILYAGTTGTRVYRSDDAGASWRALAIEAPEGLCEMGFPTRVIRVAVDPSDPDHVYAALEVGGLVRSLDGGRTWSSCNAGLLAFAERDGYRSRILSDTETEGMMDSHALAISPASPGTVFLANRMGLFRSPDRGESWEDVGIGRFSHLTYARDVRVSPRDPGTLIGAFSKAAVSDEGSLWRSADLGATWERFDHDVSIESTLMIIAASARDPRRVYCAARRGQVFGTADGGATWTTLPLPDGVEGVYALACA